jgi:hypothetical protein
MILDKRLNTYEDIAIIEHRIVSDDGEWISF